MHSVRTIVKRGPVMIVHMQESKYLVLNTKPYLTRVFCFVKNSQRQQKETQLK